MKSILLVTLAEEGRVTTPTQRDPVHENHANQAPAVKDFRVKVDIIDFVRMYKESVLETEKLTPQQRQLFGDTTKHG